MSAFRTGRFLCKGEGSGSWVAACRAQHAQVEQQALLSPYHARGQLPSAICTSRKGRASEIWWAGARETAVSLTMPRQCGKTKRLCPANKWRAFETPVSSPVSFPSDLSQRQLGAQPG